MQTAATHSSPPDRQRPSPLETFDQLPDSAYVRLPVVAALYATTPSTIWRWVKTGRVPTPVKLGPQSTAWRVAELRRSLASLSQA